MERLKCLDALQTALAAIPLDCGAVAAALAAGEAVLDPTALQKLEAGDLARLDETGVKLWNASMGLEQASDAFARLLQARSQSVQHSHRIAETCNQSASSLSAC